ncbi:MAG: hypothetical protein K1W14_10440 [Muribaculaceae bacterium]
MSEDEKMEYDADLKAYRDIRGQLEYAKKEGYAKGFLGAFAERFAKICSKGSEEDYDKEYAEGIEIGKEILIADMKEKYRLPIDEIVGMVNRVADELRKGNR